MNDQKLNEAIDNINLIKQVIVKTSFSITSLGKIFLGWGVLFFIRSVLNFIDITNNKFFWSMCKKFPPTFYSISFILLIAGLLIYVLYSRKTPLLGLSKQLMNIWLFAIGFNIIVPNLVLMHDIPIGRISLLEFIPAILLTTFALTLYFTYILTSLKLTKYIGIVYVIAGFFAFLPGKVQYGFVDIIWPLTFLVLGVYLEYKSKKARGN